jgi:multiple sugar transport system permease protein
MKRSDKTRYTTISRDHRVSFYVFISPWVIGFLLFEIVPIVWGFSVSLTNQMAFSLNKQFIGLKNYATLLADPEIRYSFLTTFIYTISSTALAVLTGLVIALLLEREVIGRGVFRTILYFPYMIPLIAVGWIFKIFLDRDTGFFNIVLSRLGLISANIAWLADFPRGSVVSLSIWMSGWSMIIFLGGLSTVPSELYEVATIDGAGYLRRLQSITLPLLSPFIFFQFVTSSIYSMQKFIEPYILNPRQQRGGQIASIPPPRETFFVMTKAYDIVFARSRYAYGLALLWLLFAIILIITVVFIKLGGFFVYMEAEEKR